MPLLAGNPDVDEILEFPRSRFRGWGGAWKMAKWLRATVAGWRPDLALDFQGLFRSALIGRASGAHILSGLSDAREGARWFYHRTIPSPPQPIHAVERYLALAEAETSGRGLPARSANNAAVVFPLPPGEPVELQPKTADGFILVHPYSRGNGKSLSLHEISRLLRKISNKNIVLVGRGETIISEPVERCVNLLNRTTLAQLIWLIRHASFVLSVDSGPAHLAAALGKPMVAIHSWSDPRRVGPYYPDAWVWKNSILTQVSRLDAMEPRFFEPRSLHLRVTDLDAIARLATSPSDFSA